MKPIKQLFIAGAFIGALMMASCVGKGKYLSSQGHVNRLRTDSTQTHGMLDACNTQVKLLENDKTGLQNRNQALQSDMENLSSTSASALNKSKMTIADQAKRLRDLENLIQSQRDVMGRLRKSIADALVNFKPDELSVYIKDGNVYVSMEEKLLFKSGSAVVDPKGKEALGKLASVLNVTQDVTVMVEGHTDTVPIKTDRFEDNWALSTARAQSIVRILTKTYTVDPHIITAAGKGEFHPVKTNETTEGKAGNRRTEIILSPNLKELYALLGQ